MAMPPGGRERPAVEGRSGGDPAIEHAVQAFGSRAASAWATPAGRSARAALKASATELAFVRSGSGAGSMLLSPRRESSSTNPSSETELTSADLIRTERARTNPPDGKLYVSHPGGSRFESG
jgi:hypothetical protein